MKIIIQGDFYDCQIIRGRVFLWDTNGWLGVLDIRNIVHETINKYGNQFEYTIHKDVVDKFMITSLRIKGGIFPLDSAYMGNHLYTATESGLYRRYLQEGEQITNLSKGYSKKLIDVRFVELAAQTNIMAMAGASEGVFELYNPRVYRIAKSGHQPKEIEKGIYSVIRTSSKSVWYEGQDIGSVSNEGVPYLYRYRMRNQLDDEGRMLRTYIKQENREQQWMPRLPAGSELKKNLQIVIKKESTDMDFKVALYGVEYPNHHVKYGFTTFNHNELISISSKPRRVMTGGFGMAVESKRELVIVRNDQKIIRVDGPITRARVVSGFGRKNNLLAAVCSDFVMITDFYEDS